MENAPRFTLAEEATQVLLESPGVIRQSELQLAADLRADWWNKTGDWQTVRNLLDSLKQRFEDGWLIELGRVSMYRDHTGVIVIDDSFHPYLSN